MEATRIRLAEGVHLTYLPARKFKTSLLSAQFVTPLRRETAGANALLAAVLRRAGGDAPGRCLRYRGLTLDPDAVEVRLDGRVLEQLTAREFELLRELLSSPGRVFTREILLAKLWGYDFFGDERVVDSHIKNLRKKLGVDYIETVRGVGYRVPKEHP